MLGYVVCVVMTSSVRLTNGARAMPPSAPGTSVARAVTFALAAGRKRVHGGQKSYSSVYVTHAFTSVSRLMYTMPLSSFTLELPQMKSIWKP